MPRRPKGRPPLIFSQRERLGLERLRLKNPNNSFALRLWRARWRKVRTHAALPAETGGQPVIPPKRNRTFKRAYDVELYKERNIIERFFNKLKQFRRVATRYDKLLKNFMGFVKLAAIAICLK
jgi:putative transposase